MLSSTKDATPLVFLRRLASAWLSLVAGLVFPGVATVYGREAPPRPNVVLVVIDNVDFRYLGQCYGGDGLTLNLDKVALDGVKFTRAYAVTPLCVPSRYTCLTGRYASRYKGPQSAEGEEADFEEGDNCELETNLPNLASELKKAGYDTGFVGKYHLDHSPKGEKFRGKDGSVFGPEADAWLKAYNAKLVAGIRERGFDYVFNAIDFRTSRFNGIDLYTGSWSHNMEAEVLGALNFFDQNRKEDQAGKARPFFLYFSTHLMHLPFDRKFLLEDYEKYGRVTEGGLLPEAPRVPMASRQEIFAEAQKAAGGRATNLQVGMHWLDSGIGAVIERLRELGELDNTLIIVFSDNNQRGKQTLYEGGARVPLLMMWPKRFRAGTVCNRVVGNIDLAPTILDACGITPPANMNVDGRSILPIVGNPQAPWRDGLMLENGHTRALVTDDWKYVALRYPPDVQAKIDEVDRTGKYPKLTQKAEAFFDTRFKESLTPEQWKNARNSWRWHVSGNNYMKSIDDFPFQFDADQLFDLRKFSQDGNETENVASVPQNAAVLAAMKDKLKKALEPVDAPFPEFKPAAGTAPKNSQ